MNTPSTAAPSRCPFHESNPSTAAHPADCPVSGRAAAFDPFEDGYQQDPPAYLKWSREEEPVFYNPKLGYWVVTRYEDIKAIFRDNQTFSPSIALEKITPTGPEANEVLKSYDYQMNRTLVNEDEPAHMPRRRLLMAPFTPNELKHHEPMVRRLTREYVDRFVNDGKADLVDQMFWEIPLTVALHFLGIPEEDMGTLRRYSIAHTINTWGRPKPEEQVEVAHAVGNFWQLAGKLLDKMRADPSGPGWMQYGIRMQAEHPDVVTDSYLHSMMMAGIVAAHETTANATANAVKLLLEHPDSWREICEDPGLIPNAVEECLRLNGSIAAWRRLVTKDTTVGGIPVPAGSKLLIVTSSANHDERHFADAEMFDIRRENSSDQLTFGYGSHQCMGMHLARMEMQIFLEELTQRLPHMRLCEQAFTYVPNTSFRGPEHLYVEWNPSFNPERTRPDILQSTSIVRIGDAFTRRLSRPVLVDRSERAADDVLRLRLIPVDGRSLPRWAPGSHIDIECGETGISRQYSLCGDPDDAGAYEIAVLREANSRGGSAWLHQHAKVGQRLKIRGPRNHFRLDEQAKRIIFIAGGIGITPISAMAKRARALGLDYTLHYSGRKRSSMALLEELSAVHGERLHVYAGDEGRRNDLGRLLSNPDANTQIYACGPASMLEALESSCVTWPEDALRTEKFEADRALLDPSREHGFEVELRDAGVTLSVAADQTLLGALRAANVDVQSDCEEGLCGSCEVRVLAGEIDHRDSVLTRRERDSNTRMMACCSRSRIAGAKIVLDL